MPRRLMCLYLSAACSLPVMAAEVEAAPPTAWPSTFTTCEGHRFVRIPGGSFEMGPLKPDSHIEAPRHKVTLSNFYIAAFEVTKGQFRRFADATGVAPQFMELDPKGPGYENRNSYQYAPGEDFPVFALDWHSAAAYARWLSAQDGRSYRLPTEAEWEYACRAGTETWRWWGDEWCAGRAFVTESFDGGRAPYPSYAIPGTGPANPWGLYEVLGNASEWTGDWYGPYDAKVVTNPTGLPSGRSKVIRGGSVEWHEDVVNSFLRSPYDPGEAKAGIRLVCEADRGTAPAAPQVVLEVPGPAPSNERVTVALSPEVGLELMRLPAGKMLMGTPGEEFGHGPKEEPMTMVTISYPFLMGRYEVTQRQYELVTGTNPSHFRNPDHPVEQVSYREAQAFGITLTQRERLAGRIGEDEVYRLPTEPEWEYACRGGTTTAYSFGNEPTLLSFHGWCDGIGGTHPVGTKRPNAWGLSDMHGNVQEWCWGTTNQYPGGEVLDPMRRPGRVSKVDPKQEVWYPLGAERVARGGGWCFAPHACRSGMRQGFHQLGHFDFIGFRLVRAPSRIDVSPVPER